MERNMIVRKHLIVSFVIGFATSALAEEPNMAPSTVDADLWRSAWAVADTHGDGQISHEEAIALNPEFAEWFDLLDADGDGFISPEEALAGRSMRHSARVE